MIRELDFPNQFYCLHFENYDRTCIKRDLFIIIIVVVIVVVFTLPDWYLPDKVTFVEGK